MKKRTLSLIAISLLLLTPAQAQNYRVVTDSIFDNIYKILDSHSNPIPCYRTCVDSLIEYVRRNYEGKSSSRTEYTQVFASVNGSDEKLRKVKTHIMDKLLHFNHLQQFSEQIDDGTSLRGRYIAKLQPECGDTSAYVFLKYDRNLLVLKQSSNDNLKWSIPINTPTRSHSHVTATTVKATPDESLSLWRKLRDDFYNISIIDKRNVQVKFRFSTYRAEDTGFYLTDPAPANGSKMKFELMRIDDQDTFFFSSFRDYMELAGREEGTVNGSRHVKETVIPDTCQYYYACHTFPDGLAEFIGVTHEDSVTYLIRATSETPGLIVNHWGKTDWMTESELKEAWKNKFTLLGIWVYDADTKKSLSIAKITTLNGKGQAIDVAAPRLTTPWKRKPFYRYVCRVPWYNYYKIKVEAKGYETGYGEIWVKDGQEPDQIEVFLKPKKK